MLLPECRGLLADAGSLWLCGRSLSFGSFCLLTLALGVFAGRQIWPIFVRTRWYLTNLCMLALTALQMALLALECLIVSDARLLVVVKYFRGVQVAISCMLYGKSACEMVNRAHLYTNVLAPTVLATAFVMTLNAVFVVALADKVDCRHGSWLLMSIAGFVLAAIFAIPGRVMLDEIRSASKLQQQSLSWSSPKAVAELEQSHHQLWVLLVCNLVSSSFQLLVDAYVSYNRAGLATCDSLFFEDRSGLLEQTARLLVSVVTFLVPNWAVLYVFYLLPRFQFATGLDIPDLDLDELDARAAVAPDPDRDGDDDADEATYHLLGAKDFS